MSNRNPRIPSSRTYRNAGANSRGDFLGKPIERRPWEAGVILNYSPQQRTYTVSLGQHGAVENVRRMVSNPGDMGLLPRGTEVVLSYEIENRPLIVGVLPSSPTNATEVNPARITEVEGVGGESGVYPASRNSVDARPPNAPTDVVGDDWVQKSVHDNNFMAVLSGGTNVMQSSPMAQVRTHAVNNMVETMAWLYRHISSMGNLEIINDGGKTSLVWRAGSDQLTENGANQENWTIRLDAGATGDLFRLAITTPQNNTLCELHMSADGKLSLTGVAGVDISSGDRGVRREDVGGDAVQNVAGASTSSVEKDAQRTVGGSQTTQVAGNDTTTVGGNASRSVSGDAQEHVSTRARAIIEGGSATDAKSGNVASQRELVNGGEEVVLGNPARSANPAAEPDYKVVNYGGNVYISVSGSKKVVILSSGNDGVLLGADGQAAAGADGFHTVSGIQANHHVAMYEELKDLIETLLDWADNHTHLSAMGPTGPAQGSTTGPASAKVKPKLDPVKSTRVAVGG